MDGQQANHRKINTALKWRAKDIVKIKILASALAAFSPSVQGYNSPVEQGGRWIARGLPVW